MVNLSDLIERYNQFIRKPFDPPSEREVVSSLFQTDLLRILMVKREEDSNKVFIDVEVAFPIGLNSNDLAEASEDFEKDIVRRVIMHLEYLLVLANHGYTLGILGESCVWTASKQYARPLEENDFELLLTIQEGKDSK